MSMFRSSPATEPVAQVVAGPSDPIPLSLLSLDHPEPPTGWSAFLASRGILTELDDIGRWCVSRAVARELLTEQREQREASDRKRAEAERQAIEADQRFRAQLYGGIPASVIGDGVAPAAAMLQAARDGDRPHRRSLLDDALSHESTLVIHPIEEEDDGWVVGGGDG
jgi:hypothetical protein